MGGSRRKLGGEHGQNILHESKFIFNKELGKCGQLFFKKSLNTNPQTIQWLNCLTRLYVTAIKTEL